MRLSDFLKYDDIVVQCHDNPDADALASGFGIYEYLKAHGKEVRFIYSGRFKVSKSNLTFFILTLNIPIEFVTELDHEPELLITSDCFYGEGNVKQFPCFGRDHDLPLVTYRHQSEQMLALGRQAQSKILLRFIICQIIQRDAEHLRKNSAFIQIRKGLPRFPFCYGLSCYTDLFRNIFLRHLPHLPHLNEIIFEHFSSPIPEACVTFFLICLPAASLPPTQW